MQNNSRQYLALNSFAYYVKWTPLIPHFFEPSALILWTQSILRTCTLLFSVYTNCFYHRQSTLSEFKCKILWNSQVCIFPSEANTWPFFAFLLLPFSVAWYRFIQPNISIGGSFCQLLGLRCEEINQFLSAPSKKFWGQWSFKPLWRKQ